METQHGGNGLGTAWVALRQGATMRELADFVSLGTLGCTVEPCFAHQRTELALTGRPCQDYDKRRVEEVFNRRGLWLWS